MAVKKGKDTTTEDIYHACRIGDDLFIKEWVLNPENDINTSDQHGFTPLHYACSHGLTNIVDYLLTHGARNDILNMGGDSILHLAVAHGKYDVVLRLMKTAPDPNICNEHGNTPLHYAAFWNYIGICEVLVKQGAVIAIANKQGDTAYSKARPTLKRKLQGLADEFGQSLVTIPHRKSLSTKTKKDFLEFRQRQMEIEQRQVTMSLKIEEDQFGEVWKGSWSGHTVHVKKLFAKHDVFSSQTVQETFPREYPKLRILTNENISPLLAVILEPQIHLITMHYPLGTLYHILHDMDSEVRINIQEGVKLAKDICHGMRHIHSLEPIVNRFHLNPYNIVVDNDLTAKIDLSRYRFSFMDSNHMYHPQWCAPELLQKRPDEVDKRAADMYSFAVILWEIATGKIPYAGLSPMMAGFKIAKENARPVVPQFVNSHIQRIIDICWNADPGKRPKFDRIEPIMEKLNVS
ncbi:PREDICTED: integrin-linked protein kinase-like [Amphimedon queenslandica]|uniref:Protein kinase domain-containing protein n=1 Tax=Amphimedon queenslandica TaxID=400682 RepID=A0A1X7ULC7_AMPQE|nr:PREDICTED: integrin-linked protein kinase-like [Amphimedon queenslandica]|eukprot:XP_019853553.1 PREDICTED: integrin-linked protein kinase-like [Amphimedon queenslandica]